MPDPIAPAVIVKASTAIPNGVVLIASNERTVVAVALSPEHWEALKAAGNAVIAAGETEQ